MNDVKGLISFRVVEKGKPTTEWLDAYVDGDFTREKFDDMCTKFGDAMFHYIATGEKI